MFTGPPKQVFVQSAVRRDTRGAHPAASPRATDGRYTLAHCKWTLVYNTNIVRCAVFSTTRPNEENRSCKMNCHMESVKEADVVSIWLAGGAV